MNLQTEENGIRSVFTLSAPTKKLRLKRVNVNDGSTEGLRHIIRCKRVATLKDVMTTMKDENNSDDVELTVVSTTENALIVENTVDNETRNSGETKKVKSEQPVDQNSSNVKIVQVSNKHMVMPPNSTTNYNQNSSADDEDSEYISLSSSSSKRSNTESQERRQAKYKVFREEWLDIDIFRDWLDRDPTNPRRARCVACNTTMNAGKSELEKHAAGARHERAVEAMHQSMMLQQLAAADAEAEVQEVGEIVEDEESSNDVTRDVDASSLLETAQPIIMEHTVNPEEILNWREQQVVAMNRVATAIESLSGNIVVLLERLSSQQGELTAALRELMKK